MPDVIRIGNDRLTLEVSSLGAELQSLTTSDGLSWLWNGDPAFWAGRSPILFPIVGKAPDNRLSIDGKSYDMQQHGIARRREFHLVEATGNSCLHELVADDATRAVYPFDFRLTLRHTVDGDRLTLTAEVANLGDTPMPFGIGFHTAFAWPLPGTTGDHTIELDNRAEPALVRLEGGLRLPGTLPSPFRQGRLKLEHELFEDDAMIFPEGAGSGLTYGVANGARLRFAFENLPNLALWTKPGAPFICIEPWHGTAPEIGASDDIADRPYSLSLAAGASARFGYSVEILR